MSTKFKWACPKCGAKANGHGKGGQKHCRGRWSSECSGFICECEHETGKDHGLTLEDPCTNAYCYHCGEGCTFPKAPKGLQSWEKKALEAGWTMSLSRRRELGLEETKKKVVKTNDKRVKAAVKVLVDGLRYHEHDGHGMPKKVARDALAALGMPLDKQP
jgi:hypothetical protein